MRDEAILERCTVMGKQPPVGIGVEVEECYLHCPKAFRRSKLWEPEQWPDRKALPSMARVLWDQLPVKPAATPEEYERASEEGLKRTLY